MYMPQNGPMQQDFLNGLRLPLRSRAGAGSSSSPVDERDTRLARSGGAGSTPGRARRGDVRARGDDALGVGRLLASTSPRPRARATSRGARSATSRRERGITDFDAVLDIAVAAKLEVGFVRARTTPMTSGGTRRASTCSGTPGCPRRLGRGRAHGHDGRRRLPDPMPRRARAREGRLHARGDGPPVHGRSGPALRSGGPGPDRAGSVGRPRRVRSGDGRGRAVALGGRPARRRGTIAHRAGRRPPRARGR